MMASKRLLINGKETPYILYDDGTIYSEKRHRFLKGHQTEEGYIRIAVSHEGENVYFLLHRAIAEHFLPNPNNFPIVHHKNHIRSDNRAENLEWVSEIDNAQDCLPKNVKRTISQEHLDEDWEYTPVSEQYMVNKHGQIMSLKTGRLLSGGRRNGYVRVSIDGKSYSLHCLVFEAFNGYRPDYIDHIDGDKENNAIWNLREVSQSENMKNAYANGHKGQIAVNQIDNNGDIVATYKTIQEAADAMGVTHAAVRSAINRNGTCKGFHWQRKQLP